MKMTKIKKMLKKYIVYLTKRIYSNERLSYTSVEKPKCLMLNFMRKQITLLEKEKRFGTAKNYQKTYSSFNNFLNGKDVLLSQLNESLINEYSLYLEDRGLSRNSISFYMRNLRAVYNKAMWMWHILKKRY